MSAILTPQQLLPNPQSAPGKLELDLDEIQGDVLIGLQKFFQQFVFFKITDVATFKRVLRNTIAKRITTRRTVRQREFELAELKNEGKTEKLPLVGLNVGFSISGIAALAGVDLGDDSFNKGAKTQAPSLNDPLSLYPWLSCSKCRRSIEREKKMVTACRPVCRSGVSLVFAICWTAIKRSARSTSCSRAPGKTRRSWPCLRIFDLSG